MKANEMWLWKRVFMLKFNLDSANAPLWGRLYSRHQPHPCTSTQWLADTGPICSALCLPDSSWALNGCHEHSTGNGNGLGHRGNGRLSSPLWICDTLCVCVCIWVNAGEWHEASSTHFLPAQPTLSQTPLTSSTNSRSRHPVKKGAPLNSPPLSISH